MGNRSLIPVKSSGRGSATAAAVWSRSLRLSAGVRPRGMWAELAAADPIGVEVKAASWLQMEGHSRVFRVSAWSDSRREKVRRVVRRRNTRRRVGSGGAREVKNGVLSKSSMEKELKEFDWCWFHFIHVASLLLRIFLR